VCKTIHPHGLWRCCSVHTPVTNTACARLKRSRELSHIISFSFIQSPSVLSVSRNYRKNVYTHTVNVSLLGVWVSFCKVERVARLVKANIILPLLSAVCKPRRKPNNLGFRSDTSPIYSAACHWGKDLQWLTLTHCAPSPKRLNVSAVSPPLKNVRETWYGARN